MEIHPDENGCIMLSNHRSVLEIALSAEIQAYRYPVVSLEHRECHTKSYANRIDIASRRVQTLVLTVEIEASPIADLLHIVTYVVSVRSVFETGPE